MSTSIPLVNSLQHDQVDEDADFSLKWTALYVTLNTIFYFLKHLNVSDIRATN